MIREAGNQQDRTSLDRLIRGFQIDTQMMVSFGTARERTEAVFRDLLAETGSPFDA